MNISLEDKIIVIADQDAKAAQQVRSILADAGARRFEYAADGSKVYEVVRPYHNNPEKIGLIVISEDLPQCYLAELCKLLACGEEGVLIPFLILTRDSSAASSELGLRDCCMAYFLDRGKVDSELRLRIEFIMAIRHERLLRHKHEERLINELAERKLIDAKLKYLVVHDELTGLLNRSNLEQHIKLALNRNRNFQQNGTLMFIDLDKFSLINELEGFDTGDRLIVEIVSVIRKVTEKDALLARIGSDEFCLYLENQSEKQVRETAERIRRSLDEYRFITGDVCYRISASIGIATLNNPKAVSHPRELISRAHQACILAKENGRNMICEYSEDNKMIQERHRDVFWVPLIREALVEKNFFLVYQPVINLYDGRISHYEVLIRMRSKDGSVIEPGEFIPVAERMGLIHSIDLWVVENAIDFLAALPPEKSHVSLAINLSSVAFQDPGLLPTIKQKLEMTWVNANRITFEITETAAVENFTETREMISKIRSLGCHFALDDFGAGFCSFNYLKIFPVDYIKIDGQFIQNVISDETDQVLVRSMSEIAQKLGKRTIAEYVECPKVVKFLTEIGINLGQGYLFGKPSQNLLEGNAVSMKDILNQPKALETSLTIN
ncbi:MAG: putative bifunctional diguanylate cyclase/phosphodiesterase [Gammaproteobacteria bacterium]